ncbi:ABC transporter ATP-binding protein, partial [Glaesserella parasuis]
SGEIVVENCKINGQSDRLQSLWGKTLVMLPQEPRRSLNPLMRISRQLWESFRFVAGLSQKNAEKASEISLTQLGLSQAQQRYPHQLSGGMAQ